MVSGLGLRIRGWRAQILTHTVPVPPGFSQNGISSKVSESLCAVEALTRRPRALDP